MTASKPAVSAEGELLITRIFNAPRDLVWKAWTDPEQNVKWMGPRGYTASNPTGDFRPGGAWRLCLRRDEDEEKLWHGGVYREIVAPKRMVYTFAWEGDDGLPENEMLITINFTPHEGNKTKMTFHQTGFRSAEQRDGHNGGWNSTFDRLAAFVGKT